MYKIGDKVVHQREGGCTITEIVDLEMNDVKKKYYILEPVLDKKASIYIGVTNKNQTRIRPIINRSELKESGEFIQKTNVLWIDDAKKRYAEFNKSISSFEFLEVLKIFKCLTEKKEIAVLSATDEQIWLEAKKLICSEISLILNEDYEEVESKMKGFVIEVIETE